MGSEAQVLFHMNLTSNTLVINQPPYMCPAGWLAGAVVEEDMFDCSGQRDLGSKVTAIDSPYQSDKAREQLTVCVS